MTRLFRMAALALGALLVAGCAEKNYAVRADLMKYESEYLDSAGSEFEYGSTLFKFDDQEKYPGNKGSVMIVHLSRTGDDERGTTSTSYLRFDFLTDDNAGDARVRPDTIRLIHSTIDGEPIEQIDAKTEKTDCDANGCRRLTYRVYYPLSLPDRLTETVEFEIYTRAGTIKLEFELPISLESRILWTNKGKLFNWFGP